MLYGENFKFILSTAFTDRKGKKYAKGDTIGLYDIIDPENDAWEFKREGKAGKFSALVIKHYKIQEIRRLAGLQPYKEPELIVSPTLENGMTAAFSGAFRLPKDRKKPDLVIGEANKANTQIGYVTIMAHKRWFDRAVLDCLELFDAYSDIESEVMEQNAKEPEPQLTDLDDNETKVLMPFVQSINGMTDLTMLDEYVKGAKPQLETANVSEKARKVLNSLYAKKKEELSAKF